MLYTKAGSLIGSNQTGPSIYQKVYWAGKDVRRYRSEYENILIFKEQNGYLLAWSKLCFSNFHKISSYKCYQSLIHSDRTLAFQLSLEQTLEHKNQFADSEEVECTYSVCWQLN